MRPAAYFQIIWQNEIIWVKFLNFGGGDEHANVARC